MELDLVVETGHRTIAVEVKSGATVASAFFHALQAFPERAKHANPHLEPATRLIHGGDDPPHLRNGAEVLPWTAVQDVDWS